MSKDMNHGRHGKHGKERKGFVPGLRFPEFQGKGEWYADTLVQIAKFRRGSFPQPYGLPEWYDDENGTPFVQVFDVSDDLRLKPKTKNKISNIGAEQSVFIVKGTLIVTLQGSIGRVAITQYDAYIDRTLLIFEDFFKPIAKLFFAYVIQNLFEIEKKKAPGGIIKTITKEVLSDFVVLMPPLPEQKKIADCLTSLDELITAETHKLEAYKAHKKGLMQKLFPAEGETVPEWRFPEFRDNGDWEDKKFGQLCHFVRGPFGGALKKEIFVSDGYAVYEQSHAIYGDFNLFRYFITQKKYKELNRFAVLPGDIIMSCSGTMGKFAVIPETYKEGIINQALLKLSVNNGYHLGFIKFTLELPINQDKLLSQSAGGAIKNVVGVSQMKEIPLSVPKDEEQQKIADCLSSIDELISAQAQKIDVLKAHKKGLIQGLFPVADEVGQ